MGKNEQSKLGKLASSTADTFVKRIPEMEYTREQKKFIKGLMIRAMLLYYKEASGILNEHTKENSFSKNP